MGNYLNYSFKSRVTFAILVLLFIMLALTSCVTQDKCQRKFPPSVTTKDSIVFKDSIRIKDSVSIRVEKKDSIVIVQGISGKDSMPCNENGKTTIRRGGDVFTITTKNGKVYFDYDLKGTESRYQFMLNEQSRVINELKLSQQYAGHSETKVVVSVVEHIPWWAQACCWIVVAIAILYAIRYLILKLT